MSSPGALNQSISGKVGQPILAYIILTVKRKNRDSLPPPEYRFCRSDGV